MRPPEHRPERLMAGAHRAAGHRAPRRSAHPPPHRPRSPPTAPVARIIVSAIEGVAPFTITLLADVEDADGIAVAYTWTLPSGAVRQDRVITHELTEPGAYEIDLAVEDDDGLIGRDKLTITVLAPAAEEYLPCNDDGEPLAETDDIDDGDPQEAPPYGCAAASSGAAPALSGLLLGLRSRRSRQTVLIRDR